MPQRLEVADVDCPAAVLPTAPVEVPFPWEGGIVRRVHIVIPAGHAGLTGISLGYGHQPVMPRSGGAFISGDDDVLHFDYTDAVPGVQWSAFVCNLDITDHSWQVRFELDELGTTTDAPSPRVVTPQDVVDAGNAALATTDTPPPPIDVPQDTASVDDASGVQDDTAG